MSDRAHGHVNVHGDYESGHDDDVVDYFLRSVVLPFGLIKRRRSEYSPYQHRLYNPSTAQDSQLF